MTPHNEANLGDIAKTVIMPGDPLRAKYIAETFLEDYKLVNKVRGMYAYTGKYKGKEITVMAHGMGMPSAGIYTYELYKFYDVDNIIRIGSCGAHSPSLNLFDVILSQKVFTESNYALTANNDNCHVIEASEELNNIILETAQELNYNLIVGNTTSSDYFDVYMEDQKAFLDRIPKELNVISAEMEAFAIFYNARMLGKKAACLMSVVDSPFRDEIVSSEDRQLHLDTMIKIALESSVKL